MTMTHESEVIVDREIRTVAAMKSAFVIKKGAYEKLVCQMCRFAGVWPYGAPDRFTPVTLTCVAHCSHCDAAI